MKIPILYFLLVSYFCCYAVGLNLPVNASQDASSGLNLLHQSPSCFRGNPALQGSGVEISATQLFGLSELPFYNFNASKILSRFSVGMGASWLNNELYQELNSEFAISYCLGQIQAGISLVYIEEKAEGFEKISALSSDFGLFWNLKKYCLALAIKNFTETEISGTKLPVYFLWESSWEFNEKAKISIGLEKEKDFDFTFRCGSKYQIYPMFGIIGSYQFEPDRIGVGAVFTLNRYEVNYSFRTHRELDINHYVSLSYRF